MIEKAKIHTPKCLEKPKTRIPMFGKTKIQNSNVRKRQKPEFQSFWKAEVGDALVCISVHPKTIS